MKFIHLILLFCIFGVLLAEKRLTKTSKKNKNGMSTSFTVYFSFNSGSEAECTMKSADVQSTTSSNVCFTCSETTSDIKSYFTSSNSQYCLNWYQVTGSVSFTNPSFKGKYYSLTLTTGTSSTVSLKIQHKYHVFSSDINDTDGGTLASAMQTNGNTYRTAFKSAASSALSDGNSYITNKSNYDTLSSSASSLSTLITNTSANITALETLNTADQATLTTYLSEIVTLESELQALQETETTLETQMSSNLATITEYSTQITTLSSQKTSGTADSATFKTSMDSAQTAFEAALTNLKTDGTELTTQIAQAKTDLETDKSLTNCKATINKMLP
jgi:hypothetical protein